MSRNYMQENMLSKTLSVQLVKSRMQKSAEKKLFQHLVPLPDDFQRRKYQWEEGT